MTFNVAEIYRDLHANPELSFQETRTAEIAAKALEESGYTVTRGLGRTGVVGVLANGDGPVVMLRADMDGLPVLEDTGLDYASKATGVDPNGLEVPIMHACGHDVHVACLIGAAEQLANTTGEWSGTLVAVFQPAEELGLGAKEMVAAGLYDTVPRPDVVLGQHVGPLPAGFIGIHSGITMAASDSLNIHLHGEGGHGSRPESTIDPVVMAAATALRLQGVVAREVAASDAAVVTVGQIHAGTKNNIIPAEATLGLSIRTFDPAVREKVLKSIERIANGEAAASGATRPPDFEYEESLPVTFNNPDATARTAQAFGNAFGPDRVFDPGVVTGSEDVGNLATPVEAPLVFWFLGGADPALVAEGMRTGRLADTVPSNHSPFFAPLIDPTLEVGVQALVIAAREWLD